MIYFTPRNTSTCEMLLGTTNTVSLLPYVIPYKFTKENHPLRPIAQEWLDSGLTRNSKFVAAPNVDKESAIRHIICLFNSWNIPREDKISYGAFFLSLWFKSVDLHAPEDEVRD